MAVGAPTLESLWRSYWSERSRNAARPEPEPPVRDAFLSGFGAAMVVARRDGHVAGWRQFLRAMRAENVGDLADAMDLVKLGDGIEGGGYVPPPLKFPAS